MDSIPLVLKYFLFNAGATISGILYWMAIENMQPIELKQTEHKKLVFVFILSLLITPIGAWVVSTIMRLVKISPMIKSAGK